MIPHIEIENRLQLHTQEPAKLAEKTEALAHLLASECDHVNQVEPGVIRFQSEWEPPMKLLKQWSKEHPESSLVLLSESFAKHHWLLKATVHAGKSDDLTVSRIDDEFESLFQEIFGCTFADWEKRPCPAFNER